MAEVEVSDDINGVVIVTPKSFGDSRGRFVETFRRSWFPLGREMVQGNRSDKEEGAIVGLHYHFHQADYWYVMSGRAQVVLHDLRISSPTEGATLSIEIGVQNEQGIFVPPGVAHGFASLTDVILTYMVDNYYNPNDELGVAWNDPEIDAKWQIVDPVLSERDQQNPAKHLIPDHLRPRYPLRSE